jgi:hypothetical protein
MWKFSENNGKNRHEKPDFEQHALFFFDFLEIAFIFKNHLIFSAYNVNISF